MELRPAPWPACGDCAIPSERRGASWRSGTISSSSATAPEQYAAEKGLALIDNRELVIPREQERFEAMKAETLKLTTPDPFRQRHFGTVGAVALDAAGRIVAGTSTGGSLYKRPGRVGDSPLVGSGYYADVTTAGVSTTGWGESIIRCNWPNAPAGSRTGAVGGGAARAIEAGRTRRLAGAASSDRPGRLDRFRAQYAAHGFRRRTPFMDAEVRIEAD
jgi:hypothetical protein